MNQKEQHSSSEWSFPPPPPPPHHGKTNKTISTHIIDALDEFYGVRRERTIMDDDQRGGLIEEEDMNEFDEDVVCLSFENNTNEKKKKKKEDGKQQECLNNNNNGIIDDDDDDERNMMMRANKTNKTTQTIKSSKTGLFDGIHNGIFSIGRGVSTGAQFLGDTVVSGVAVTTNASLYLGKTTVNIGKDAVMHSFNAISSTLITTAAVATTTTTTTTTTPSDVDEELIDDMSNVLLSEAPPRPRGLSIETILLDATTNTKRIATTTTATLASSSLATYLCLCGNRIERAKMEQRVCSYLRIVVCGSCFSGDTRIIPRDVLHRWDFTEKPVCKQSLRFLEDAYAIPVISLRKLGEVNRYYYSTSISSKEEFTRLRGFLDLQIKVASLFHRVGEKLRLYNMEKDDEGKKEDEDDNDDTDDDDASKNKKRNRKALLHFLASIPDDKRRLVRGGDDAKVSIKELKELHEFRKQSEICEYLSAIEDEVVNVLESSL